jgi:predicted DNA-binding transcriptional regulator AlpA
MNTYASRSLGPRTTTVPVMRNIPVSGEVEARAFSGHTVDQRGQPHDSCGAQRNTPIRMLRIAQVLALTGLGKTKIYELQAQGDFPMRVQLTPKRVAWVEAEVQAWLAARVAANTPLIER